jgi:3-oxoadipate enol-lactonase
VTLPDVQLHVADQGRGRPLLLVHGFPLDHSMWQGQIDALTHDCRVIAPDLRGFGRSPATAGIVTMERFADDLAATLDRLEIHTPVVLCGLSMGGYIAWQFWRRHRARLAALVLCDTRAGADAADVARGRLATAERVLREGPGVLADTMLERLFAPATLAHRPELVEAARRMILNTSAAGAAAALRGMAERLDWTDQLGQIDVPTHVVCGQNDVISPSAEMQALASRIAGSQFTLIPDAGHMSPLENPAAVNAAIRSLLRRL